MTKRTLILGLGVSGIAAAEYLLSQGGSVLGIDRSVSNSSSFPVQSETEQVDWLAIERVIVSPGISPKHSLYQEAVKRGIPLIGEAQLALPHITQRLVAVTGTNGKTTVALLAAHLLNACGIKAKQLAMWEKLFANNSLIQDLKRSLSSN